MCKVYRIKTRFLINLLKVFVHCNQTYYLLVHAAYRVGATLFITTNFDISISSILQLMKMINFTLLNDATYVMWEN